MSYKRPITRSGYTRDIMKPVMSNVTFDMLPTSAFDPTQIAGLVVWLDAQDDATITETSNRVSGWADKSGNGNDASASGATRPSYNATGLNGLPMVQGNNNSYVISGTMSENTDQTFHIFNLLSGLFAADAVYDLVGSGVRLATTSNLVAIDSETASLASTSVTNIPVSSPGFIYASYNNSTTTFDRYNNGSATSVSGMPTVFGGGFNGTGTLDSYYLLDDSTGGNAMSGGIGEYLIYTGSLALADRQKIEGYLAHKWGLESNLPVDHPYKSAGP